MFCPIKSRKKNLLKSLFTKILLKMYLLPYLCPYNRESYYKCAYIVLDLAHSFKEIQLKLEYECTKVVQPLRGGYIFGVPLQRKVCTWTVLHNQKGF